MIDPALASADRPRFLTNGVPAFVSNPALHTSTSGGWSSAEPVEAIAPDVFGVAGQHRISLEVELYDDSDRPWACPTLAAWWQLVRLGALEFLEGVDAPTGTERLTEGLPFGARRSLTVLSPEFLEVEHAVRTILTQVHMEDEFLQWLTRDRSGRARVALPSRVTSLAIADLAEISYLFVHDDDD